MSCYPVLLLEEEIGDPTTDDRGCEPLDPVAFGFAKAVVDVEIPKAPRSARRFMRVRC